MPRYEFSEGSSNKFWQIDLKGTAFTTSYGKIGSSGQTTIKNCPSAADAKKEYDKLVAEKTKKGYALVGGKAAPKVAAAPKTGKVAAAPKAGKPAAPAKAAAPGSKRYFENQDDGSSKFWEAWVEGTVVKTRFGKLGASGQIRLKDLGDKAAALAEHGKLIAEKVKGGYVEGGGAAAAVEVEGGNQRNPELEAAIVADPYDRNAWMVLADWLQDQGDPRGELMALQIGNKAKPAAVFLDKHRDYFLGPLGEHQQCYDGSDKPAFTWRNGFIFGVRLSHNHYANEAWKGSLADVLTKLLDHPSGRFITEMTFQDNNDPNDDDLQDLIDLLAKRAPKSIRRIEIGDEVDQISWYNVGDLGKLWKAVPHLKTFLIEAGSFELGKIDAPELARAVFKTGGLSADSGKSIATMKAPALEELQIYYGDDNYGGDCTIKQVKPLLDRTDLPALRHLGLLNAEFADDICRALAKSKLLPQLAVLDLSMGCMTDEGAAALVANKDAFAHLDELIVDDNYLTPAGVKSLKGLCKKVRGNDQKDDDDPEYRSVSVAE